MNSSWSPCGSFTLKSFDFYRKCSNNNTLVIVEVFLCLAGMLNTAVIAFIFTRPRMRSSSMNILLAGLEISNFLGMTVHLPHVFFLLACPTILAGTVTSVSIEVIFTLTKPFLTFTNWLTPVIGTWRFLAVTFPIKAQVLLTRKTGVVIMIVVSIFSVIYSLYVFMYHSEERSNYSEYDYDLGTCFILPHYGDLVPGFDKVRGNFFHREAFLSLSFLLSVLPCAWAIIITVCLIVGLSVKLWRRRKLAEGQTHVVTKFTEARVTIVLVIFMVAHSMCYVCPDLFTLLVYLCPQRGFDTMDYFCPLFYHFPIVIFLSFLALLCYCLMSIRFRETFNELFKIKAYFQNILQLGVSCYSQCRSCKTGQCQLFSKCPNREYSYPEVFTIYRGKVSGSYRFP